MTSAASVHLWRAHTLYSANNSPQLLRAPISQLLPPPHLRSPTPAIIRPNYSGVHGRFRRAHHSPNTTYHSPNTKHQKWFTFAGCKFSVGMYTYVYALSIPPHPSPPLPMRGRIPIFDATRGWKGGGPCRGPRTRVVVVVAREGGARQALAVQPDSPSGQARLGRAEGAGRGGTGEGGSVQCEVGERKPISFATEH